MSPFSTDFTAKGTSDSATGPTATSTAGTAAPRLRSASSTSSTTASLRRHAILADLNVLQVATLMGTGLLVALGVVLGGRSYITTVSPDGLVSAQPGAHGTSTESRAVDDSSPAAM